MLRGMALLFTSVVTAVFLATTGVAVAQDSSGATFVTKWGSWGRGDGLFFSVQGVATDRSGNVYVLNGSDNQIQKFDSNGTFLAKWGELGLYDGQFSYPEGLATDSSGNVYIVDTGNGRIQKFDSNGTFLATWGNIGYGDGEFERPKAVAVDPSGNVYVSEPIHSRIQKFDSNGTFLAKWDSSGSGDGQIYAPQGLATDSSGNVYVADEGNNRIQKFDSNGTFLAKWGSSGYGEGQFSGLTGLATDSSGNVYSSEVGMARIQKFDSNGTFLTTWGSYGSGDGQFSRPEAVATDSSNNVYVADWGNYRIQKFSQPSPVPPTPFIPDLDAASDSGDSTDNLTNDDTPTFIVEAEPNSTVKIYIDGVEMGSANTDDAGRYSIPVSSPLTEGSHSVTATAPNSAGESKPSQPLTITIDKTPPDTQIDEGPSGTDRTNSARFLFSSEPGATFKCKLGTAPYENCSSPQTYNDLLEGQYTFSVKATDQAGNEEADADAATRSWTVDLIPTVVPPIATSKDASGKTLRNSDITITFSEAMERSTLENPANYQLAKQGSKSTVPVGIRSVSTDNKTVTLDPYPDKKTLLARETPYSITVMTGVKDDEQNPLASNYAENFTTGIN